MDLPRRRAHADVRTRRHPSRGGSGFRRGANGGAAAVREGGAGARAGAGLPAQTRLDRPLQERPLPYPDMKGSAGTSTPVTSSTGETGTRPLMARCLIPSLTGLYSASRVRPGRW